MSGPIFFQIQFWGEYHKKTKIALTIVIKLGSNVAFKIKQTYWACFSECYKTITSSKSTYFFNVLVKFNEY